MFLLIQDERDHYESDKGQSTEQKQINLDGVKVNV
jgi:hypothetical protein